MAQTKTKFNTEELIKEEISEQERQLYVAAIENRLHIQADEIKRRQYVIDRLEKELLRERRIKHVDHVCENCSQPCIIKNARKQSFKI